LLYARSVLSYDRSLLPYDRSLLPYDRSLLGLTCEPSRQVSFAVHRSLLARAHTSDMLVLVGLFGLIIGLFCLTVGRF
jgi:hypothetical protein